MNCFDCDSRGIPQMRSQSAQIVVPRFATSTLTSHPTGSPAPQ